MKVNYETCILLSIVIVEIINNLSKPLVVYV